MSVEIEETDPRYVEFVERLGRRLSLLLGRDMNEATVKDIEQAVDRLRFHYVQDRGLKLPKLAAFVMPSIGMVEIVRADLEPKAIDDTVVYCARKYGAPATDLVFALRRAFPDYARQQFDASDLARLN